MPTCRRKRVMLKELSADLLEDVKINSCRPVFYMEQTGEIFPDYESYAARLSFYRLKQFQCEVTGKSGLDYFQALESEQQEARILHARFPQSLKGPVLRAVQWQVVGRLDHLVEAVYERFKDRYFEGERIYVDIQGDRFWARIMKVYPPRVGKGASSTASGSASPPPEEDIEPHRISGDLKIPASEVNSADDPKGYYYKVQLSEDGNLFEDGGSDLKGKGKMSGRFAGSLMDVQCDCMSRDRLAFSKSILRRFIRDCVDRDAAVASPWTVKQSIAEKYGVENVMPEETRKGVEEVKNKEIEKRKKVWEEKEGPPSKKHKKMEEKAAMAKAKEEEQRSREKAAAAAMEPVSAKKKYIKYPTEDLDVILSQREKTKRLAANGHTRSVRPECNRDLPFEDRVFESMLMVWSFFMAFGTPLKLSPFTLDEFEAAIRHNDHEQPVTLISEIHSSLIYALRALATHRHLAVVSLLDVTEPIGPHAITSQMIVDRLAEYGNNWERQPLRAEEGRYGWEEALIGCIKDQATTETFKALPLILISLLFTEDKPEEEADEREIIPDAVWTAGPQDRYYFLPAEQKLEILSFLCDTVASHKEIHTFMESCETNLTQLRKEKIEVKKERKRIQDEMTALTKEDAPNGSSTPKNGIEAKATKDSKAAKDSKDAKDSKASGGSKDGDDDELDDDLESELSEPEFDSLVDSDEGSDTETLSNTEKERVSSRQRGLRLKAQTQAHAKQREIARAKNAFAKQAQAEHRRLDEEDNKLERRMEGIEREFRKWSGVIRLKPLGKDRFHNRYWWFDGIGSTTLLASGGSFAYGAGRLFVQGPNAEDYKLMKRKETQDSSFNLDSRREDEEGPNGILSIGQWGYYSDPDQIEQLMVWLNVKGNRELKLKENLTKWQEHISGGMRKRLSDLNVSTRVPEARRSTRKNAPEIARQEPYLLWQNKKAPSVPS